MKQNDFTSLAFQQALGPSQSQSLGPHPAESLPCGPAPEQPPSLPGDVCAPLCIFHPGEPWDIGSVGVFISGI